MSGRMSPPKPSFLYDIKVTCTFGLILHPLWKARPKFIPCKVHIATASASDCPRPVLIGLCSHWFFTSTQDINYIVSDQESCGLCMNWLVLFFFTELRVTAFVAAEAVSMRDFAAAGLGLQLGWRLSQAGHKLCLIYITRSFLKTKN